MKKALMIKVPLLKELDVLARIKKLGMHHQVPLKPSLITVIATIGYQGHQTSISSVDYSPAIIFWEVKMIKLSKSKIDISLRSQMTKA